jgi:hypothetical protein
LVVRWAKDEEIDEQIRAAFWWVDTGKEALLVAASLAITEVCFVLGYDLE